jgi:hypothetical protein
VNVDGLEIQKYISALKRRLLSGEDRGDAEKA